MAEHKHTFSTSPTQENQQTIRAAVYARVSTRAQDADMQMCDLREYAQRRGWQIAHEYVDRGVCGAKEQRPALDKLWSDCRKRLIDAVIVYRYDRFARSLRQLVNALCEFDSLGIQFVSLHEGIDTSTPNGRLVFGIFASIAEFERELIRDRVRSGIAQAKAKGRRLGRPRSAVDLNRLKALRAAGCSWRTIADELGVAVSVAFKAYKASSAATSQGMLADASLSEANSERLAARE
jgi:DNA invertase Pin-like site-specific DNA recombinase